MTASAERMVGHVGGQGKDPALQARGLAGALHGLPIPVWFGQVIKFLSVGVLNTLLDTALYFALTRWLGFSEMLVAAKAISYGVGIVNSFVWNKNWTFRSDSSTVKTFIPFVMVKLAGMAINTGAMHLCLNTLGLHEVTALVLATGCSLVWNFTVSKFIIFRK